MGLQFVIGPSGSGKSTFIYKQILKEASVQRDRDFLIIVPEQFTMQSQRALVELSQEGGILNIEVLSFERLAYRIFDELGVKSENVLGDTGKMLLLKKIAAAGGSELKLLGANLHRISYLDHIKSLFSEFKQYRIAPEDLDVMADLPGATPLFSQKIKEIGVLYRAFLELMQEKYITSEMILDLLGEVISRSEIVKDAIIVLDGYTGFTPVQLELIRKMCPITDRIIVSVWGDEDLPMYGKIDEGSLFAMSRRMMSSLERICEETHTDILEPVRLKGEKGRFATGSAAICHLEKNLFRSVKEKYDRSQEDIAIYRLSSPRRELSFVAQKISALVREQGLKYMQIAVVSPDLTEYVSDIESVFSKADIPVFVDKKSDIIFHPLTEFLFGALDIVCYDFSTESVMRFLRSGLVIDDKRETDLAERYLYASGIRGRKVYSHAFTRIPYGYDPEDVAEVNRIFEPVRQKLSAFYEGMKKPDESVLTRLKLCFGLLSDFDVENKLEKKAQEHKENGRESLGDDMGSLYIFLMDLMDQMAELLGDDQCDTTDFVELLKSGMSEASIGHVPMTGDSVIFGDIERSRLGDINVLFLIGAGDSSIPYGTSSGGILTQSERLFITEGSYDLAPSDRDRTFMQRFYLYLIMTKPAQQLIITYPAVRASGEAQDKSYIIGTLAELFTDLDVKEISDRDPDIWVQTKDERYRLLLSLMRDYASGIISDSEKETLFALGDHYRNPGNQEMLERAAAGVFFKNVSLPISRAVMKAVCGNVMSISVSRMEQYASCAYGYFLKYLLRLKELREHTFESADMGSLYHRCLELYSGELKDRGIRWHDISDSDSDLILEECIDKALAEIEDAQLFESAREAYVAENIRRTLKRSVWALTGHIRRSGFEPQRFEVSIESIKGAEELRKKLPDMADIRLVGTIDRIDTAESDDRLYVKIIDYKSGGRDVDLGKLYSGLQMQLVVYMGAALRLEENENPGKQVEPAAFFYYHIHDPYVEGNLHDSEDKLSEKILKELKVKGFVSDDEGAIGELDSEAVESTGTYSSPVIPLSYKKDGNYGRGTRVMTPGDIRDLISYASYITEDIGRSIQEGNFSPRPYRSGDGKHTGCEFCDYHSVCGFDRSLEGFEFNTLKDHSDDEIMQMIKDRIEKENGKDKLDE